MQFFYNNPPDLTSNQIGDCLYNTMCGAQLAGNTYAGQEFTLTTSCLITTIGWNAIVLAATTPECNWMILDNGGSGGLPGTILHSGTSTDITAAVGEPGDHFVTTDYSIPVTPFTLAAGTYYVAIQAVTTDFQDLISQGIATSGAVETDDGGLTWSVGFGSGPALTSVSINLPSPTASTAILFADFIDDTFRDWSTPNSEGDITSEGADFKSRLQTYFVPLTGTQGSWKGSKLDSDPMFYLQAPYVFIYVTNQPTKLSASQPDTNSLFMRTAWDWSNHPDSHKWSRKVQTYRYRGNNSLSVCKTKVFGRGRVLHFEFTSETGKDFNLEGYGIWLSKLDKP